MIGAQAYGMTEELNHTTLPSRAVVHKAIRNYIVNELGISKAAIKGMIEPLARAAVADLLGMNYNQSGIGRKWLHDLIQKTVTDIVKVEVAQVVRTTLTQHTKVSVDVLVPRPPDGR